MKKVFSIHSYNFFFLVGLVITLSLLWPLFAAPFFSHHDDVQIIRLFELNKCIQDFQIPCRWVPDLGGLLGYPIFNYYAPLPYYFGEIFYLLTNNLIFSVKVMFSVAFVGSYIFMYLFSKKFWGNTGGALAAIFYSLAPYHAVDFYARGAMGELWGLMFFPAVLWSIAKLSEKPTLKNSLLVALIFALFILSHNLSFMMFFPIIIIFSLILFFKNRDLNFLRFGFLSLFLGALMSSFYLLPMLAEKDLVHVETTTYGYFFYTEHFKGLRKLIIERMWGWGASVREVPGGERDGLSFQIGWIHLSAWLLACLLVLRKFKSQRTLTCLFIFFSGVILFSIFMVNPKSEFIWRSIEPLKYIQFPWRFLSLIIFSISFLAGAAIFYLKGSLKKISFWILIIIVVALNYTYFRPEKFLYVSQEELLTGQNWDRQIKRSIFDYLPKSAKFPPAELADKRLNILSGEAEVKDFKEGSNWMRFQISVKEPALIRLSTYYFPNWTVKVDNQVIGIDYKNDFGLITFPLKSGEYSVDSRLQDTFIRKLSNLISIIGILVTLVLFLTQYKKTRSYLAYIAKGLNR